MSIYRILRKANHRLFCILKNAGIAVAAPLIAHVQALSNSTGPSNRGPIGKTKRPEKSINYKEGFV
jgi:hypothetical protein